MVKTSPSRAGDAGSVPGQGARIPHAPRPKIQNIKQEHYCNKFNKDFKNGPHPVCVCICTHRLDSPCGVGRASQEGWPLAKTLKENPDLTFILTSDVHHQVPGGQHCSGGFVCNKSSACLNHDHRPVCVKGVTGLRKQGSERFINVSSKSQVSSRAEMESRSFLLQKFRVPSLRLCSALFQYPPLQKQVGKGRDPWRRKWQPSPGFSPGKSRRQRSPGAAELVEAVAEHWRGGDSETGLQEALESEGAWTLGGSHEGAVEKRGGCDLRRDAAGGASTVSKGRPRAV